MPPLSWATALGEWEFAPVVTALVVLLAAAYLYGARRVRCRHPARPWPKRQTASFLAGLAAIVVATESSIAAYDDTLFWIHMIQHLLLIMVAPLLLLTGRPVLLALHATRNPWHRRIQALLRSRAVTALTNPALGLAVYAATIVGTHLTGFMNLVVTDQLAHDGEHALYLVAGYLFFLPLIGNEPIRWRLSHPTRMLFLLLAMPVDTFTGVVLNQTHHVPFSAYAAAARSWGPSALTDIHAGGAVMWIAGDWIMFLTILFVVAGWRRHDIARTPSRGWLEAARRTSLGEHGAITATAANRVAPIDDDAEQLAAYNAYLARLGTGGHPGNRAG
jgi:putative copper resistance protein D